LLVDRVRSKLDSPGFAARTLSLGVLLDHGLGGFSDVRPVLVLAMLPSRQTAAVALSMTMGPVLFHLLASTTARLLMNTRARRGLF